MVEATDPHVQTLCLDPKETKYASKAGIQYINLIKVASCIMIIMSKIKVAMVIRFSLLMSGLLVLQYFYEHQDLSAACNKDATFSVQVFMPP